MNTRMLASAMLGLAVVSTSVLALTDPGAAMNRSGHDEKEMIKTSYGECMSLEQQFDSAIKSHATAAKVSEARTLRTDAGKLCTAGKTGEGVIKLQHALRDLGVTPTKG